MPTPESNRRNLEHARRIERVKFWRSRSESQRVKAEILAAYFAVPQPSQRGIAQRLRVRQPYVAKLFRKIRREGPEEAVGPEAYEQYKALRDAERNYRHEALIAGRRSSLGAPTTAPKESRSQGSSGSSADTEAKPAGQEGPTEYVERVRDASGEIIELHGSAPPSARPYDAPQPQQTPNCRWVKGTLAAVVAGSLSHVDEAILKYIGHNPNRSKGWFD